MKIIPLLWEILEHEQHPHKPSRGRPGQPSYEFPFCAHLINIVRDNKILSNMLCLVINSYTTSLRRWWLGSSAQLRGRAKAKAQETLGWRIAEHLPKKWIFGKISRGWLINDTTVLFWLFYELRLDQKSAAARRKLMKGSHRIQNKHRGKGILRPPLLTSQAMATSREGGSVRTQFWDNPQQNPGRKGSLQTRLGRGRIKSASSLAIGWRRDGLERVRKSNEEE